MRIEKSDYYTTLWLSATDTYDWAHRPGNKWPCSELSGHRLRAQFEDNNLVDLTIDGRPGNCSADEFNAIVSDFIQ